METLVALSSERYINHHESQTMHYKRNRSRNPEEFSSDCAMSYKELNCRTFHSRPGILQSPSALTSSSRPNYAINAGSKEHDKNRTSRSSNNSYLGSKKNKQSSLVPIEMTPPGNKIKPFANEISYQGAGGFSSSSGPASKQSTSKSGSGVGKTSKHSNPIPINVTPTFYRNKSAIDYLSDMNGDADVFNSPELWAGPTYSNSPPPSSLPIPKFSLRQKRSNSLDFPPAEADVTLPTFAKSAPPSPSRDPCPSSDGFFDDIASATQNLRRILNLNLEED
ncbi:hypothetical protein AMTRI_Chr03g148790 [Amborella trichopoda]|uniref:Uncharacterized protein n=1 Tax=Amborella trichopoda TaxID=13333 RepID=W1NE97_AMBTC|nr:uncharacterized protein LOC18421392 [Amborella trichopoda]ERM93490.1 hypothetical protein AMTR_s00004p00020710 [Amborella trichopoda]|eukprot:XP_011620808.1 uncharacterized protein LOC18421392 [Amborella trichopoda]